MTCWVPGYSPGLPAYATGLGVASPIASPVVATAEGTLGAAPMAGAVATLAPTVQAAATPAPSIQAAATPAPIAQAAATPVPIAQAAANPAPTAQAVTT